MPSAAIPMIAIIISPICTATLARLARHKPVSLLCSGLEGVIGGQALTILKTPQAARPKTRAKPQMDRPPIAL